MTLKSRQRLTTEPLPFAVVILGPTGSGKTAVSLALAQALHQRGREAEIISADSRAIYRGLDIGTAKPSPTEQNIAPHWGLDLVDPGERFTVADWKEYTERKLREIATRGHLPLVVGGTGLYIDALIYGYSFTPSAQKNYTDRQALRTNFLNIGVATPRDELRKNLIQRVNKMFTQKLFAETKCLVSRFGTESAAFTADIYRYAWQYLQGEISLDEAKQRTFYADWHLAKRQLTWFRRNQEIIWLPREEIVQFVLAKLK